MTNKMRCWGHGWDGGGFTLRPVKRLRCKNAAKIILSLQDEEGEEYQLPLCERCWGKNKRKGIKRVEVIPPTWD